MLTEELAKQFTAYRKFLLYYPNNFANYISNNFEIMSYGRSCYSNILYSERNKNLSAEYIKENMIEKLSSKLFDFYKKINSNIIITNNEFEYVVPETYRSYIIWDLNSNTPISKVKILLDNFIKQNQFILWKNKIANQSIKALSHYHLVIREPEPTLKLYKNSQKIIT